MNYLRRTIANKLVAMLLVVMGIATVRILDDAIICLFMIGVAICLFVSNENQIN